MKKNPHIKSMYKNKVQIIIPLELVKWARVIGYSPEQTARAILEWFINPLKTVEEYSRIQKMDRTAAVKFICRTQLGLPVPKEDRSVNFVNGEKVRAARKLNGWTQTDLMKELAKRGWKMSREVMVRIEQGKKFLNDGELKILTDCLGVSPAKLINKK